MSKYALGLSSMFHRIGTESFESWLGMDGIGSISGASGPTPSRLPPIPLDPLRAALSKKGQSTSQKGRSSLGCRSKPSVLRISPTDPPRLPVSPSERGGVLSGKGRSHSRCRNAFRICSLCSRGKERSPSRADGIVSALGASAPALSRLQTIPLDPLRAALPGKGQSALQKGRSSLGCWSESRTCSFSPFEKGRRSAEGAWGVVGPGCTVPRRQMSLSDCLS